jgi:hypothetical protein
MAEVFSNSLTRAAGIVTSYGGSTIGAGVTIIEITTTTNAGIGVSHLVDNANFIAGTLVHSFTAVSGGVSTVRCTTTSTNTANAGGQTVKYLGPTTAYTSPSGTKTILVGGTFANNTNNQVSLTVELYDQSTSVGVGLASKIPVPAGSSFVISDTGKTVIEGLDELRVYTDSDNAIDVSLSVLTGVN